MFFNVKFLIVLFVAQPEMSYLERVVMRFNGGRITQEPFRMLLFKAEQMDMSDPNDKLGQLVYKATRQCVGKLNVTDIYVHPVGAGTRSKNGTFSGVMGMIQNDVADMALTPARLDKFPYDAFHVGASAGSGDVKIYSFKKQPQFKRLQLTDAMNLLDFSCYAFYCVCLYFVVIFLLLATSLSDRLKFSIRLVMSRLWNCFEVVVNQENFTVVKPHQRVVWLFFNVFVFLGIFGYFLNVLTADLVAITQPPFINSLRDLVSPQFDHLRAVILKQMFIYDFLKSANPNSDHGKLYAKLLQNETENIAIIDKDNLEASKDQASRWRSEVENSNLAMVMFTPALYVFERWVCEVIDEHKSKNQYISQETVVDGIQATYFSKKTSEEHYKYMNYRLDTIREFDLYRMLIQQFTELSMAQSYQYTPKGTMCMYNVNNFYSDKKDLTVFNQFQLSSLRTFFELVFISFGMCLVVLLVECLCSRTSYVYRKFKSNLKSRRSRRERKVNAKQMKKFVEKWRTPDRNAKD